MGQVTTAPALAPAMKDNFPEVENVVQMYDPGEGLIKLSDNMSFKTRLVYANAQIFNVFSFPLIDGIPETALEMPYSAVIDEDTARNYFRNKNPIGETLNISTRFGVNDFQITGIMQNIPVNSHFDTHIFVSLETFKQYGWNLKNNWYANLMHSYLLLTKNSDYHAVEKKISDLFKKYIGIEYDGHFLQPLADIYLKSADLAFQMKPGSDKNFIYILSFISFLILLIGCVNYVNLFTSRSLKRFKEIGVRKVFGADKSKLVNQFLCESLLMTITAVSLSVIAVCLFINPLSALFGTELNFNMMNIPYFVFLTFGIGIVAMSLSGIYPAFFLSSLKPADIFRRAGADKPGSVFVRNSLIIIQFAISVFLIVASLVITNQVRFIRNKKLGFDHKHIVVLPVLQNSEVVHKRDIIKTEMHKIPGVKASTFSSTLPMNLNWRNTVHFEGRTDDAEYIQICCSYVDYDFLDVFDLELVAGRNFSRDFASDAIAERSFIINEAAARRLRWENPLGKRMRFSQREMGTVIGVVKDFHNLPLSQRIEPVALMITNTNQRLLSIKIQSENIQETIAAIEKIWNKFANGWPFEYAFMDQSYDNMYKSEIRMKNQLQFFSAIAVFLSCFGLFGLVSFIVERRTKEIGIRKVLGASAFEIIALFTRGFTKKIILANLIVWPIAYFFMNKWLQNFEYRVNIGILVFIAASALSLFVFLSTIFYQTYKAAAANPVKSLRHE